MEKIVLSLMVVPLTLGIMWTLEYNAKAILWSIALILLAFGLYELCRRFLGFEQFTRPETALIFAFSLAPIFLSVMSKATGITRTYGNEPHSLYETFKRILLDYGMFIGCAIYQVLLIWTNILDTMNV